MKSDNTAVKLSNLSNCVSLEEAQGTVKPSRRVQHFFYPEDKGGESEATPNQINIEVFFICLSIYALVSLPGTPIRDNDANDDGNK